VVDDDVMISIDPHKASNTLAVMDPVSKIVIARCRFANTGAGYRQLREFADRWEQRRWAVEGCHGAGRSLAQRLVGDGERVLDVPAKLAARVRVYSQGHGRKTDSDDAVSIGLAALDSTGVAAVRAEDALVSLRLLCERRHELTALRTQAVCRLHRLLAQLTPGGTRGLKASRAQQLLVKLRPLDGVGAVRLQLAHQHLDDIRALDAKMKAVRAQIAALVDATGTHLTDLYGIGPLIAGRILAEVETVDRFPSRHHFASHNGTAPIDVSSGEQIRHRLSRAGNRRLNHALHMMAVTQIRYPGSTGRAYYEHKRLEGKTPEEALRCLKRRLSDVVYWQLAADRARRIEACGSATTETRTPPTSGSVTRRRPRTAPPPEPSCPTASTASSPSTGKTAASSVSRSSMPASASRTRSSRKPNSSADTATNPTAVPRSRPTSAPTAGVKAGAATRRATALTPARTTTHSHRGNSSKPRDLTERNRSARSAGRAIASACRSPPAVGEPSGRSARGPCVTAVQAWIAEPLIRGMRSTAGMDRLGGWRAGRRRRAARYGPKRGAAERRRSRSHRSRYSAARSRCVWTSTITRPR
jgi:transposase